MRTIKLIEVYSHQSCEQPGTQAERQQGQTGMET